MAGDSPTEGAVPIYEMRLRDVTAKDILQLVSHHQEETQFLEYIQEFDLDPNNKGQAARDVVDELVAMSNHSQGMLILGVAEEEGRATDIRGIGDCQAVYDRVMQSFGLTVEPARPDPEFKILQVQHDDQTKNVLLFSIVAPEEGLRLISTAEDKYKCPVRVGTLRRRMSYIEIRDKIQQDVLQSRLTYIERMLEHIVSHTEGGDDDGVEDVS